ncbi:MAG: protein kinase [Alphaproteobacteria bacterium]|nr:protein kinase [Alphaproteobacteria bacterium]
MRTVGNDGATETFTGILDQPAGKQVIVRKVLPALARDPARLTSLRSRVGDLKPIRHAALLSLLDAFEDDGSLYIIQEWVDAVSLAEIVEWCNQTGEGMPHNVFLNLAVQICNGLEALHSQPGAASGARHVLHLSMRPEAVFMTRDGDVMLGGYGLVRSPTLAPHSGGIRLKSAYISPEQTHQDQKLTPASDLFSLGAVLYEVLAFKPMFKDSTPLKTIARVRRAEVTTQLLEVKEILPGLDRVLYRALSLNQRHRYQRAFVLREDLRGLMAGYSFSNIQAESRAFLEPLFQGRTRAIDEVLPPLPAAHNAENTQSLLDDSASNSVPRNLTPLDDEIDTGSLDSINAKLQDLLAADGDTGPTGSFDPNVTQPFARREPQKPPSGPVGLGPSGLADIVFGGSLQGEAEELDLLDPGRSEPPDLDEPSADSDLDDPFGPDPIPSPFRPPPKPDVRPVVSTPRRVPTPEPQVRHAPEPVAPEEAWEPEEAPEVEPPDADEDEEWDEGGSSGPVIAGALLAGLMGVLVVFCAGTSVLGVVGASQVASSRSAPSVEAPTPVAALPAEEPVVVARAEPLAPPRPVEKAARSPKPRPIAAVSGSQRPPEPRAAPQPIARVAPEPRPVEPAIRLPDPAPRVAAVAPARVPAVAAVDPTLSDADWDVDMMVAENLSPLDLQEPPPTTATKPPEDLGAFATAAYGGQLGGTDQAALAAVPADDPGFTRSRVLLYQDAKARGDSGARRRWMDELMAVPENRYRPELLVEHAAIAMADRDYEAALDRANRAEQYWSRLPRDLMFTRKAMIHEIQAQASYALYTRSDPPREAWLDGSIDAWSRYRTHVLGAHRTDLLQRADERIATLEDVRKRMH